MTELYLNSVELLAQGGIAEFESKLGGFIGLIQKVAFVGMLIGALWTFFVGGEGGRNWGRIVMYGMGMLVAALLPTLWGQIVGKESIVEPKSVEEAFGE